MYEIRAVATCKTVQSPLAALKLLPIVAVRFRLFDLLFVIVHSDITVDNSESLIVVIPDKASHGILATITLA